jgi:hypothetical protein
MSSACNTNWEKRNACRILVREPEERRSLGERRCRWVGNAKQDLGEMGWDGLDLVHLAQDIQSDALLRNGILYLDFP